MKFTIYAENKSNLQFIEKNMFVPYILEFTGNLNPPDISTIFTRIMMLFYGFTRKINPIYKVNKMAFTVYENTYMGPSCISQ